MHPHTSLRCLCLGIFLGLAAPNASAQLGRSLEPGDILVANYSSEANLNGRLYWINPANGQRVVVTDFNNAAQGPVTPGAYGAAVADLNTILMVDSAGTSGRGALIHVDPATGWRTIVSDFGNPAQGPLGVLPILVAVISGQTFVIDRDGGSAGRGALIRVNRTTGQRTLVSDFGNPAQGELGDNPHQISRGQGGVILVIDADAGTDRRGILFRIDPVTGFRTVVSDFGNAAQGGIGINPGGVTQGAAGVLLVSDTTAGTAESGLLFTVNPQTGQRTPLSDFANLAQGPAGVDPFHLAVSGTGAILVLDENGGTDIPNDNQPGGNGALFAVNRLNGNRTLVTDFGNITQGPIARHPSSVVVVPMVQPGDALLGAMSPAIAGAGIVGVSPANGRRRFVSDFASPAQGPIAMSIYDVAIGSDGDILALDLTGNTVFIVDRVSGVRTLVSSLANAAQGPTGTGARSIALGADGNILVGITTPVGVLSINPMTGMRTLLHNLGDVALGIVGRLPEDMELRSANEILLIDADAAPPNIGTARGLLFNLNLTTGLRTVVSDFSNAAQGPLGSHPTGLAREAEGHFLVSEVPVDTAGLIFRINLGTGIRTVLSDFGNPAQGPGRLPKEVTVASDDSILILDTSFDSFGRGALLRADPGTGMRTLISSFRDTTLGAEINTVTGLTVFPEPPAMLGGPAATDGVLATSEDTPATGSLVASDPNNLPLIYSIVHNGTLGSAVISNPATGAYTYTPLPNVFGADSFTFMASNGSADSNVATVQVTIAPVNDAPVASAGLLNLAAGSSQSGTLVATDIENNPLTFALVTTPANGVTVITNPATGAYTYTANAGPSAIDVFTFKANDGALDSNIASIAINITGNQPPVAANATISTAEDKSTSGTLKASDPEGAKLTYSLVANGTKGTATITNPSTGRFTYVPGSNLFGSDQFTFRANDGVTTSNVATVNVTIIPVNDAPVASSQSVATTLNTPAVGQLLASDVDGDPLTFAPGKGKGPRHGTVVVSPSGAFSYTPTTGFTGTDSFGFQVTDGTATANSRVTVTVSP
jgi:hypothetical protein